MTIDSFSGDFRFLSNFYPSKITYNGKSYETVEHAFQAAKALNPENHDWIQSAPSPAEAKKRGRKIIMRPEWERIRVRVMYECLVQKFTIPELREALLATADVELMESNYWHDTFWGVCQGNGENHLGKLLMKIRQEIRDGIPHTYEGI